MNQSGSKPHTLRHVSLAVHRTYDVDLLDTLVARGILALDQSLGPRIPLSVHHSLGVGNRGHLVAVGVDGLLGILGGKMMKQGRFFER